MRKLDKICVAAWLDAEGSLGLYYDRKTKRAYFRIYNNNLDVMHKLNLLLPDARMYYRKGGYILRIDQRLSIYTTLRALLPYLIVSRRKARRIIKWYKKLKGIALAT